MDLAGLLGSREIVILDGAMGTELHKRGFTDGCACNITRPEAVTEVHKEYLAAGCNAIITNTLTMNRISIESHGQDIDVEKVNTSGAALALAAAGDAAFVLGNLSSTGQLLEPYGTYLEEEFVECFKEQASILAAAGVHGFIIETIIDLREALCALKACREVSPLPVIACMSYFTKSDGGRTQMGNSVEECTKALVDGGASAVGANCGSLDPAGLAELVATMAPFTKLPIVVEPNAGKPRLEAGATVFDMGPADFSAGMLQCRDAGARILGGCCGTTPGHISAMVKAVRGA
jgi:5-methyltetrahydrofolate--homocysteine methyltransferase